MANRHSGVQIFRRQEEKDLTFAILMCFLQEKCFFALFYVLICESLDEIDHLRGVKRKGKGQKPTKIAKWFPFLLCKAHKNRHCFTQSHERMFLDKSINFYFWKFYFKIISFQSSPTNTALHALGYSSIFKTTQKYWHDILVVTFERAKETTIFVD